ncbi:GNAT family N-acetyltransferase [Hamadaea tsunoensis]|uniref:GNAT family N-acetyltransferase n=1 Tax=Hamadaea tsunoensis TaxID=53368 RepID=UPI00040C8BC6|nr:N-acetyltransferase [Hamadaea tsunoensis]
MIIRGASLDDATAIADLKVRAWRSAYAGILPDAYLTALDEDEEAADWAEYLEEVPAEHRLWIVDDEGLIGYCRTGPAPDADLGGHAAEVYGLYIEPDFIGTGLGARLFRHAVEDLVARGYNPVCVYAYAPNEQALAFYDKAGFVPDTVTRLDHETGVPEQRLIR